MPDSPDENAANAGTGDTDAHLGAIEGDRPEDPEQQGNPNLPALDDRGLPRDRKKICEDVLGANEDRSQG